MENRLAQNVWGSHAQFLICAWAVLFWAVSTMLMWLFAFWHLPEASPEWLVRAQQVCFGRLENGLPDLYGWILLVLTPLSLITALVVACWDETLIGLKLMVARVWGRSLGICIVLSFVGLGVWVGNKIDQAYASEDINVNDVLEFPADYPMLSQRSPNFSLVDQSGAKISLADFKGKVVFVSFVFAHCKTVCPALLQTLKAAMSALPDRPLELLLISLDPWRDTPSSLPSLAQKWQLSSREHVLSGLPEVVQKALQDFQVATQRDTTTGDIAHPALVYVVDRQGTLRYVLNNPATSWLVAAAERALNG